MIASVSTWSAHQQLLSGELSAEAFLRLLREEGAAGVEIVDIDFENPNAETIQKFYDRAEKQGVEVTCLSIEHSLCRMTKKHRLDDAEKVKKWMKLAKSLGVRNVRVFTGWMENEAAYRTQLEWVYEGMRILTDEAEKLDINLVLENHNNVCFAAEEIIRLMTRLHSPRLFTCPDVFNYKSFLDDMTPVIADEAFAEIEPLIPFAKNAHVKICEAVDGDTQDRYLDISRLMNLFGKHHYDGPVALEFMWPYLSPQQDATEEMRRAIRVLCHHIKNRR